MKGTRITTALAAALLLAAVSAAAQSGTALDFDGGDYLEIADSVDVRGPLTIEAWIRPDSMDGGRFISNRSGGGYEMDVVADGRVRFTLNGSVAGSMNISAHVGSWVHVAATWAGPAGGDIVLYVNGAEAGTSFTTVTVDAPASVLRIGAQPGGNYRFDGGIDDVRVYSAVVDPATIAQWRTRAMGPSHPYYAQLEGAWSFEEGSGQTVANLGPVAGRDGTLGSGSGVDDADPAWIDGGFVGNQDLTMSRLKVLFR